MNSLLVPRGIPGINVHPVPELPADAVPWVGQRTLLVADDVRSWLPPGSVAQMTSALDAWADAVVAAAEGADRADVVLAIHPGPVETVEELLALATGHRDVDVDVRAEPSAPASDDPLVRRYDAAIVAQLTEGSAPSRLTKAWGRVDAAAAVSRALAPDDALAPEDATAVRAACIAALGRVERAVTVVGLRQALLWPAPRPGALTGSSADAAVTLPLEVAVGVALDVLRAPSERRAPRPANADEIDRLEKELIRKQRQVDAR